MLHKYFNNQIILLLHCILYLVYIMRSSIIYLKEKNHNTREEHVTHLSFHSSVNLYVYIYVYKDACSVFYLCIDTNLIIYELLKWKPVLWIQNSGLVLIPYQIYMLKISNKVASLLEIILRRDKTLSPEETSY